MAHMQQFFYINAIKQFLPEFFEQKKILEIGSLNINGSIRQFFTECDYHGIDVGEGRDVDSVCAGEDFGAPASSYDVVISCEAMEHNPAWRTTWLNMLRLLKPGGLLVMTCASSGRRQHGTEEFVPADSPLTVTKGQNYYRNLVAQDFESLVHIKNWFVSSNFNTDNTSHDLYFFGVNNGASDELRQRSELMARSLDNYYMEKNIFGRY